MINGNRNEFHCRILSIIAAVAKTGPESGPGTCKALPRAGEARFDSADGDAEGEGDLVVAQAIDFTQHDGGALIERQLIECLLQPRGQFLLGEDAVRRRVAVRAELAVQRDVLIERHLIRPVATAPEAVPVARLVDGDAVDPGAEARLTAEPVNGAEDAKEDFLREIQRFVVIAEQVHGQLDDHPLVFGHELRTGRFLTGRTALDERRLSAAYVAPTGNARLLHGDLHYTKLDPGRGPGFHLGLLG